MGNASPSRAAPTRRQMDVDKAAPLAVLARPGGAGEELGAELRVVASVGQVARHPLEGASIVRAGVDSHADWGRPCAGLSLAAEAPRGQISKAGP